MPAESLRVAFAGTPEFAVPTLQALIDSDHDVVACFTQPDRPAGRGRKPQASPVKQLAAVQGITVNQPERFDTADAQPALAALGVDVLVVVAYGLLLPQRALDIPRLGCLNVHASLLPRWRGAAPIHRAIQAGDSETGVCVMQMAAGLDTGDVWSRWRCDISDDTTSASLHDTLAAAGASLLVDTLPVVAEGAVKPTPQDDAQSCYARKLDKSEAAIDWRESAETIARQVRAFNPWPVAQCTADGVTVRLWDARATDANSAPDAVPGQVVAESNDGIVVQTGEGCVAITALQLAGKRRVSCAEFLNGRSLLGHTLT